MGRINSLTFPSPSIQNGIDAMGRSAEKPRAVQEAADTTKPWQLAEISEPGQCRVVTVPNATDCSRRVCCVLFEGIDTFFSFCVDYTFNGFNLFYLTTCFIQIGRLLYTNSGVGVLALGSNGIQKLWKWSRIEQNPTGKVLVFLFHFE